MKDQCAIFQKLAMMPMLNFGRKKAPSFEELAKKIGVSVEGLEATMKQYNEIAKSGQPDPLGKLPKRFVSQDTPPFYAMDVSFQGFSAVFTKGGIPVSAITLGGLVVNEKTGEVVKKDGSSIQGLYAAGTKRHGPLRQRLFRQRDIYRGLHFRGPARRGRRGQTAGQVGSSGQACEVGWGKITRGATAYRAVAPLFCPGPGR